MAHMEMTAAELVTNLGELSAHAHLDVSAHVPVAAHRRSGDPAEAAAEDFFSDFGRWT